MISQLFMYALFLIILGLGLLLLWIFSQRNYGTLSQKNIYFDTDKHPAQVLRSTSIPLAGKPDYLIKSGSQVIPVELKTGRTPESPRKHHVMQLMAYCYLVEENYGVAPQIGILKYPDREFQVAYSPEVKQKVKEIVYEILQMKNNGTEPRCYHPNHNKLN